MIFRRPYKRVLDNVLNLVIESAYFLIFVLYLSLHFTSAIPENFEKRQNLGLVMIGLIIVIISRCLVDLVMGLIRAFQYVKKYCGKKNKIAPLPKNNPEVKFKQKNGKHSKKNAAKKLEKDLLKSNKKESNIPEAIEVSKSS